MEFKKPARSHTPKTSPHVATDTPSVSTPKPVETETDLSKLVLTVLKEKSTLKIITGTIVVTIIIVSFFVIASQRDSKQPVADKDTASKTKEKPKYDTVLPKKKSIDALGGWKRISPPKNDPVYAFLDKIGETPISVSEQPLPDSFKGNSEEQLSELAKKFNATTKLQAGATTAYLGTSAKGPQSVIFVTDTLLILIKSQNKINEKDWTSYIQSLN